MLKKFKEFLLMNMGMAMVAFGMYFFLMPNNLATGGANGLGIVINEGKIGETQIPDILASKDRTRGGKTVPPQGLYLNEVYYDKDKGSEQGE